LIACISANGVFGGCSFEVLGCRFGVVDVLAQEEPCVFD
jgi:hypothetical protein